MPFTLGLPYPACIAATRLARKLHPTPQPPSRVDQKNYYLLQYRSSDRLLKRFASGIDLRDKVVLDLGSGLGGRAPWFIEQGASSVFCVDINRQELAEGNRIRRQLFPQFSERIHYLHPSEIEQEQFADAVFLVDSFEHLRDPAAVLRQAYNWLRQQGVLWIGSVGWYNFIASHVLSVIPIPWCQLIFSERAIIRTMSAILHDADYAPTVWDRIDGLDRWDQVQTLKDRPGEPLNMLSLRQAKAAVRSSNFEIVEFGTHGVSAEKSKLLNRLNALTALPVLDELLHKYYTVRARPARPPSRPATAS
ncbi:MAG: class I SAM-dependent methyltransferase [Acidobacteriaceae bacterium]